MLYMPDAIRATLELMEAPAQQLTVRTSYNLAGMTFNPVVLPAGIKPSADPVLNARAAPYALSLGRRLGEGQPK